ncbi:MAG: UDP-glucose 4-epimerase GalE [Flavobacteriales bacterium]|nr:UDP-glucose 4-epimerase GalE [Flavobacteriales bacterium]|tara:strand:- start:40140 stop:41132 length:993 start_codon:yes stop_codon:yes gene_type:complete
MKIIVTGGAGYIGSHTVVELLHAGFNPIIIDNLSNTDTRNIKGIKKITGKDVKFYNVDCTDSSSIKSIFEKEKDILALIHFAAFKSVEESLRLPEKYFKNNIGSLEVILYQMKKHNIDNIIFSSSCTVYGSPEKLPVTESSPFRNPESPYAETKQKCEEILKDSSLKSISLRYFNPIGSHPTGLIGDCSADRPANLVPIICEVASKKRENLVVNGNDYNTVDGTCVRDYIHVIDLAKSHVQALKYLLKNNCKEVFNIGTGQGLSILEIIHNFEKANQVKINFTFGPRRDGDIDKIYSDNLKVNKKLKWSSQISINQAMIDSWNWQLNKIK